MIERKTVAHVVERVICDWCSQGQDYREAADAHAWQVVSTFGATGAKHMCPKCVEFTKQAREMKKNAIWRETSYEFGTKREVFEVITRDDRTCAFNFSARSQVRVDYR